MKTKKAIILLSGGLDAATCLAAAIEQGFTPYALTFDYGQRSRAEIESATALCQSLPVKEHKIFKLSLEQLQNSSLTDATKSIPTDTDSDEIPSTYVPARNMIFFSIAISWAETIGAYDLFYGANRDDYAHYPDCRPEFISSFESMANLSTKAGIAGNLFKIHTPLLTLSKTQVVQLAKEQGVAFEKTSSCYNPSEQNIACGTCESCQIRLSAFKEARLTDPLRYL